MWCVQLLVVHIRSHASYRLVFLVTSTAATTTKCLKQNSQSSNPPNNTFIAISNAKEEVDG